MCFFPLTRAIFHERQEKMKVKAVLFDLDGTLLNMDQDEFVNGYFKLLARKMIPHGYTADKLFDTVWKGTAEMVKNDGSKTNEEAFWSKAREIYGEKIIEDKPLFDEFYIKDFRGAEVFCKRNPKAKETVLWLKSSGFRVALATNPVFPISATELRIKWAGLDVSDFELCTAYENSCFAKPNPAYYLDVAKRLSLDPKECLMVGNDVDEDMAAKKVGMGVFLLTDCLINKEKKDISPYPHGDFDALNEYIKALQ